MTAAYPTLSGNYTTGTTITPYTSATGTSNIITLQARTDATGIKAETVDEWFKRNS